MFGYCEWVLGIGSDDNCRVHRPLQLSLVAEYSSGSWKGSRLNRPAKKWNVKCLRGCMQQKGALYEIAIISFHLFIHQLNWNTNYTSFHYFKCCQSSLYEEDISGLFLHVLQAAWLSYGVSLICRRTPDGPIYVLFPILPPILYVVYSFALACNVAWLLIWDKQYMEVRHTDRHTDKQTHPPPTHTHTQADTHHVCLCLYNKQSLPLSLWHHTSKDSQPAS